MLPVLGNYLIGMFKETPLLAVITIPELFQAAKQIAGMTYRYNEPYTVMALMFLAISVPTSLLFNYGKAQSCLISHTTPPCPPLRCRYSSGKWSRTLVATGS